MDDRPDFTAQMQMLLDDGSEQAYGELLSLASTRLNECFNPLSCFVLRETRSEPFSLDRVSRCSERT